MSLTSVRAQTCARKKNGDICTQPKFNCILLLLQSTDSRGSLGSENSSPERGVVRRRRQFGRGRGARGSSESDESNVMDTNTAEQERASYEEPLLQGTLGSYVIAVESVYSLKMRARFSCLTNFTSLLLAVRTSSFATTSKKGTMIISTQNLPLSCDFAFISSLL